MTDILTFTDAAITHIKDMLIKKNGLGFRVKVKQAGCSGYKYVPDVIAEAVEGDIHFKINNDLNIYIDPQSVALLKGLQVDFVEEQREGALKQKRLVFINPNEMGRCGCGESFHV